VSRKISKKKETEEKPGPGQL